MSGIACVASCLVVGRGGGQAKGPINAQRACYAVNERVSKRDNSLRLFFITPPNEMDVFNREEGGKDRIFKI